MIKTDPMIDHDRLFKELISTFFTEFLDLFLPEVRSYTDARSLEFLDKETFQDITAGDRRELDLLAKLRFKGKGAFQLNRLNWRDFARKENPVASALMAKMRIAPQDRARVKLECVRLGAGLKLNKAKTHLILGS